MKPGFVFLLEQPIATSNHGADDHACHFVEHLLLQGVESLRANLGTDNAKSAEFVSFGTDQGCSGVEANLESVGHQRIVLETKVLSGIRNNQHLVLIQNDVSTEGVLSGCFGGIQADLGEEPLTTQIYKRNEANGNVKHLGTKTSDAVELFFALRVQEKVGVEDLQSLHLFFHGLWFGRFLVNQWQSPFHRGEIVDTFGEGRRGIFQ
mmetsp:Transcript_11137/g.17897  ORF Transcript_11137/g.17897 Transcript_11137/m.17897 type:complete len:207 (-) Transcript_11137:192-812(-)